MPGKTRHEFRALRDASYGLRLTLEYAQRTVTLTGSAYCTYCTYCTSFEPGSNKQFLWCRQVALSRCWSHSMDDNFESLLQAGPFTPAPVKQSVANVIDEKRGFYEET